MVIALGMLANGEITIAMEILRRIPKEEAQIKFVVHEKMSKQIITNGFSVATLSSNNQSENLACFHKAVKEFSPDLILCADVFTMDFSATWSGVGLKEVKAIGVPVGTLDDYEWESTHFIQDFAGVPMRMKADLITQCDFLVRPCPVNRPEQETLDHVINCSLFDVRDLLETYQANIKMKSTWRESLGIKKNSKVVMVVNSPWEYVEVGRSYESARLIEWIPRIIHNYLSALEVPITVLHVGGREWTSTDSKQLEYRHFTRLDPIDYNRMIHCSDLFCGTNLISVTLSQAALCGVPILLFQNDKGIDFSRLESVLQRMPEWYQTMAQEVKKVLPFKVFPWGWHRFLVPVMKDNLYDELFDKSPIFEPKKSIDLLRKNLFDEEYKTIFEKKRERYIKSLEMLAQPSKILEVI